MEDDSLSATYNLAAISVVRVLPRLITGIQGQALFPSGVVHINLPEHLMVKAIPSAVYISIFPARIMWGYLGMRRQGLSAMWV